MNSDKEAINKLKGYDEFEIDAAFNYIYDKYSKLVYTYILAMIKDTRDAEELTNDTFIKLFNKKEKLCDNRNLKYYILTIAKNTTIDFVRKNKMEIVLDDEYIFKCASTSTEGSLKAIRDFLCNYVDVFDVDIMMAHIIFNETFDAIAKYYKLSIHTVKTRYFRAVNKIKIDLREEYDKIKKKR